MWPFILFILFICLILSVIRKRQNDSRGERFRKKQYEKAMKYCLAAFPQRLPAPFFTCTGSYPEPGKIRSTKPARSKETTRSEEAENQFRNIFSITTSGPGQCRPGGCVPDPGNCSRYQFLDFIEQMPQKYMPQILTRYNERGYILQPEFAAAAYRKLRYGLFINPLDFEKEFGNQFDFIVFDPGNDNHSATILYVQDARTVFRYRLLYKNTGKRHGCRTEKEKAYIKALNQNTVVTWNTNKQNLNSVLDTYRHAPVSPERMIALYGEIKDLHLPPDRKMLGKELDAGNFHPEEPTFFYARVWVALRNKTGKEYGKSAG